MKAWKLVYTVIPAIGLTGPAMASNSMRIDFGGALAVFAMQDAETPDLAAEAAPAAPAKRYGEKNSWRWYVQGAYGVDLENSQNRYAMLGGGVAYYLIKDFSVLLEVDGLYFDQTGANAFGATFAFLLRWDVVARDTWSFYLDGGIGVAGTTEPVPPPSPREPRGGTDFNFTPQLGLGFSWQLTGDVRLLTGARWFHMSNARTHDNNPGLDSLMIYVGASFPF